ncbi:hypothetical protein BRCH_03986c [Candidatus Burkholderia brachyanthoides]|nr:hypothetical protein BRCH_03986c [Candidatus Burkholderia brachyanthoides]
MRAYWPQARDDRPRLTVEERAEIVAALQAAMGMREREVSGNDSLVKTLNRMPEDHHRTALGVARSLALHDGPDAENPFSNEQLQRAFRSEQAFVRFSERDDASLVAAIEPSIIDGTDARAAQDLREARASIREIRDVGQGFRLHTPGATSTTVSLLCRKIAGIIGASSSFA